MKWTLMIVLLFTCFASWAQLEVQHWQTKNGVPVSFVVRHELPIVNINISFAAGSAYDGKHFGLANLVGQALTTGTQTHDELAMDQMLDRYGADVGVDTGRDMTVVSMRSLTKQPDLDRVVQLVADMLGHAIFPDKPWLRLRNEQLVGIKLALQNPATIARQRLYQIVYDKHPYAHPVVGTVSSVPFLTVSMARRFYRQYYVAHNAMVSIVGDLTTAQARKLANELTATLAKGKAALSIPKPTPIEHSRTIHVSFPSKQTTIMMAINGVPAYVSDMLGLKVANIAFGGGGLVSQLSQVVREQHGLVYRVGSNWIGYRHSGLFVFSAQTRNASTEKAVQLMQAELKGFCHHGMNTAAFTLAKQYLAGQFPIALVTNGTLVNVLSRLAFYHFPHQYLQTFLSKLQQVDRVQANQQFAKVINSEHVVTVTVGGQ